MVAEESNAVVGGEAREYLATMLNNVVRPNSKQRPACQRSVEREFRNEVRAEDNSKSIEVEIISW